MRAPSGRSGLAASGLAAWGLAAGGLATGAGCIQAPSDDEPVCVGEACDPSETTDSGGAESGLLGVDCVEDGSRFTSIASELAEVETVAQLTWSTPEPGVGQVAFTFGEGNVLTPAQPSATEHGALLLGIPTETVVTYRLVSTDAEGVWCSAEETVRTGHLPASLPELTVSELDPSRASGAFVPVSLLAREDRQVFIAILDGQGRYVWYDNDPEFNYRMLLSHDHQALLSNTQAPTWDGDGKLRRTAFTGQVEAEIHVPGAHTDFTELPDGTLATLAWDLREYPSSDGGATRRILGDKLVEVAADGTQTQIWSVFDDIEPDLSVTYESGWDDVSSGNEDWSHANGLSYDPEQDAYFVTFYRFEGIARIDRATGTLDWIVSPLDGSFTSPSDPFPISNPHAAHALGANRLLVLNRGWFAPGECSEAVEVTVDPDAHTVSRDWTYATEDCLQNVALGDAQRLPNGNTLVDWSFSGQIDEVTPDGEVVWRVNTDLGEAFGFTGPVMSLY